MPRARPRAAPLKFAEMMASPIVSSALPPSPCSTRPTSRTGYVGAVPPTRSSRCRTGPHRPTSTRRWPNPSPSRPTARIETAYGSTYAVSVHASSDWLVPKARPNGGQREGHDAEVDVRGEGGNAATRMIAAGRAGPVGSRPIVRSRSAGASRPAGDAGRAAGSVALTQGLRRDLVRSRRVKQVAEAAASRVEAWIRSPDAPGPRSASVPATASRAARVVGPIRSRISSCQPTTAVAVSSSTVRMSSARASASSVLRTASGAFVEWSSTPRSSGADVERRRDRPASEAPPSARHRSSAEAATRIGSAVRIPRA